MLKLFLSCDEVKSSQSVIKHPEGCLTPSVLLKVYHVDIFEGLQLTTISG